MKMTLNIGTSKKILKTKTKYLILFTIAFLFFTTINTAQYKLEIGNFWVYSNDYKEWKISITDTTTLFDSLLYYESVSKTHSNITDLNSFPESSSVQKYIRLRKDNLYETLIIYNAIKDTVIQPYVYKKDVKLGDKWIYQISINNIDTTEVDTIWAEVEGVFEDSVFGEIRTVKKILYRTGFDFSKYFCEEIGELAEEGFGYFNILKGCYVNGVAYGDTTFTVVSVDDPNQHVVKYKLEQNYPNPFNANTIIAYSIPHEDHIKIIVYDILGKEVATLVNKYHTAGNHKISFDASLHNDLRSGVYFYRLVSSSLKETRKMIYLK